MSFRELRSDLADVLMLAIFPARLGEVAIRATHPACWLVAWFAFAIDFGCGIAGLFAGLDEPYPSLPAYFEAVFAPGAWAKLLLVGLVVYVPIGVVMLVLMTVSRPVTQDRLTARRLVNAAALAPMTALVPMLVWMPLAVLAAVSNPSFGLISGKPAWLTGPWITIPGSWLWLPIFGIAYVTNVLVAARRVQRFLDDPGAVCVQCGYALQGRSAICPECGTAIDQSWPAVTRGGT